MASATVKCGHCGLIFASTALKKHVKVCFHNPEYIAFLKRYIRQSMSPAEYDQISSKLGLPNLARIRANFGGFRNFLAWLYELESVEDAILAELKANRLALRSGGEGLPVLRVYQNRRGEICYILR